MPVLRDDDGGVRDAHVEVYGDLVAEGGGHFEEGLEDLHGEAEGAGLVAGLVVCLSSGGWEDGVGREEVLGCAAGAEVF